MTEDYNKRINKVTEYINNHIDEKMDLHTLASIANFSAFHFHRLFRAIQKETLASYITRLRVETAARFLRYSDLSIETIAYNIGYEMPSSLSKAFKQCYGITPTAYRNNKNLCIMTKETKHVEVKLKAPKVEEIVAKKVIYIRLVGKYSELDFPGTYAKLWGFVKAKKLFTAGIEHLCVYYDDPNVTESAKLRTEVCLVVHKPVEAEGEIEVKELAGGRYARFLYQGPYTNLGAVYDTIFSEWLPESRYEIRDAPVFEKYISNPERVAPEKLKTEIYIPVK